PDLFSARSSRLQEGVGRVIGAEAIVGKVDLHTRLRRQRSGVDAHLQRRALEAEHVDVLRERDSNDAVADAAEVVLRSGEHSYQELRTDTRHANLPCDASTLSGAKYDHYQRVVKERPRSTVLLSASESPPLPSPVFPEPRITCVDFDDS